MKKSIFFLLSFISLGYLDLQAQNIESKYWVFFKDKGSSTWDASQSSPILSLENQKNRARLQVPLQQFTDLPLAPEYLQEIQGLGFSIIQQSRWLNALSLRLKRSDLATIEALDFVKNIEKMAGYSQIMAGSKPQDFQSLDYREVFAQLKAKALEQADLEGRGVRIGIIDTGFENAHQDPKLQDLFEHEQVIAYQDFIKPNRKRFFEAESNQDWHGREVWALIAGKDAEKGHSLGMAKGASFFLARSDHGDKERRIEEDYWIAALEWMDREGVRLVNSSLGYAYQFDKASERYRVQDMNGHHTRVSQAAQIAVEEKGMILVVSAGNEGHSDWKVISAPADAQGVISVGASHSKYRGKVYYSSIGPDFLEYPKPELVCASGLGTSFAAPIITGFIACLLEKNPNLSSEQLKDILQQSGHLYPYPNNYLGYGIPQADRALALMDQKPKFANPVKLVPAQKVFEYFSSESKTLVLIHKGESFKVLKQEILKVSPGKTLIRAFPKASSTSIDDGERVWEVQWSGE